LLTNKFIDVPRENSLDRRHEHNTVLDCGVEGKSKTELVRLKM